MRALLKKLMGEGGAGHDNSHGSDNLPKVLKALALNAVPSLSLYSATPTVAVLDRTLIPRDSRLRKLSAKITTAGTANTTTVVARLNGVAIDGATLSVAHDDADGTYLSVDLDVPLSEGDVVDISATAVATNVAGLHAVASFEAVKVE